MDGSNSRKSDAAATRKRRSSILKSQRAPRAPLSELEFHVATPQDQAKSRRVSFSRRTGVAEFEINEATTAWKNVYEEHNKSLETSASEAGAGAGAGAGARRRVAHLGGRRAAQFEDEEADAEDAAAPPPDRELSACTELRTVQLFRLDAEPAMRELTDRLDLDFSAVAPLAAAEDDLDVLRHDLERDNRRADMSEYSIDVDFNATHVSLKADESGTDMSITDTIRSPRVAAAARGQTAADWTADKENIAVNPYAAPPPADFAVGDDCDDILVFDGKKCKFQSNLNLSDDEPETFKPLKGRRTIVHDEVAGDVPVPTDGTRGECDISVTQAVPGTNIISKASAPDEQKAMFFTDIADMTVTQAASAQVLQQREPERRRTVVYDGEDGHVSVTEAVPAQILPQKESERRKTIVYGNNDGHVSMTETVPATILQQKESERRKTIVYGNDDGHISMTEAVPANILPQKQSERRKTIVYGNDDGHISMTEAVPAQILQQKESERRKTIVYGNDDGHISMTEAVPAQILQQEESERRKTIVYGNDDGHVSMTEAVPAQILQQKQSERRKTIVYGNDDGHISMTEAVPAQILQQKESERRKTIVYGNDDGHISMTEAVPAQILQQKESEPIRTIVYGNDDGHISMTEAVPTHILQQKDSERRKTIVYRNDDGNLSVTEAVPAQILQQKESERRRTTVYDDDGHVCMTEAVPAQIFPGMESERRKTIVYGNDDGNLSMTGAVPAQILQPKESECRRTTMYNFEDHVSLIDAVAAPILQQKESERRKTILYSNNDQISMTEAVPAQIVQQKESQRRRTIVYGNDDGHVSVTEAVPAQILPQKESERRRTFVYGNDDGNVSVTEAVPVQIQPQKEPERRKTIEYGNDDGHVSMTEAMPAQILQQKESERGRTMYNVDECHASETDTEPARILQEKDSERRRTIVYDSDDADISVTQEVPVNIIAPNVHSNADSILSQAAPGQLVASKMSDSIIEKQQTVHFDNTADMSVTRAVPAVQEKGSPCKLINENGHLSAMIGAAEASSGLDKEASMIRPDTDRRLTTVCMNDGVVSITKQPANMADEELKLVSSINKDQRKSIVFEDDVGDVSMTGVVPAQITIDKPEAIQPIDNRRKTVVNEDDQGDVSMTGVVPANTVAETKEDGAVIQSNDNHKETFVYEADEDVSMTGDDSDNMMAEIQSNECDNENAAVTRRDEPSQIIVYEDERYQISRSVGHSAPTIEPDASLHSVANNAPTTLNRSLVDKVLVYDATRAVEPVTSSVGLPGDGRSDKSSSSFYEDTSPPATEADAPRRSLDALSLRSALESASVLNELARSPRRALPPPRAADRDSVLDLLLDMSTDEPATETSPPDSPRRADSDATITNVPASQESMVGDEPSAPPALAPPQPLPLEYKKEKHGVVCKLQRRLSELKGLIHYKDKTSPKKDLKASSFAHDLERGNQTLPGMGTNWLNGSTATQAGADDTRALLDALSDFTDTRRSGDFADDGPGDRRIASPAPERPARDAIARSEVLLGDVSMARAPMAVESEEEPESEPEPEPVARTLRFDDDEPAGAVLRKPGAEPGPGARPERAAVIPAYPHGVSDHVKELVEDLMKPMADVAPYRGGAGRSAAAQADLLPSSQIDLRPPQPVLLQPRRSPPAPAAAAAAAPAPAPAADRVLVARSPARPAPASTAVITFDRLNPLNNILLPPLGPGAAHKYDPRPRRSAESLSPSLDSRATQTEARGAGPGVEVGVALVAPARRDRAVPAAGAPAPVDRAVDVRAAARRDAVVNTAIAMKADRDLLAESSSLTLVDDALKRPAFDVAVDSRARSRSPVRVIFKLEEPYSSVRLDSELTSDADAEASDASKAAKRGRSPKRCTFAEDATPAPAVKVQRISNSSKVVRRLRSLSPTTRARAPAGSAGSGGSSAVTVQRLLSELRLRPAPARASDSSGGTSLRSAAASRSRTDWRPELLHEPSSKNLVSECDPSVNVVAKIDVLPFMGTSECEWESRASDTWSFRLLRARLRLLVRLAHRSGNAARALVRADTPVRHVLVQHASADHERAEPISALCLCLAAAALQRLAGGVRRAGAVPALLRRGAATARVALRWARAMRAAHVHLAFTLADDGRLSLKVANIPMRSVWEVTLRVELADGSGAWPWPRAADVRVARVVAAWAPSDAALRRLLAPVPQDWGHVPRTVWKIFKYLKNRRPEDELLSP